MHRKSRLSGYVVRVPYEDARQLGLHLPVDGETTFAEFAARWMETAAKRLVEPANERRHLARLLPLLGNETEETLVPSAIEQAISAMAGLSPSTKNKVLSTGRRVVNMARFDGEWRAGNPFEVVPRWRVPKRTYEVLSFAEVVAMLRCVREDRVGLFRAALVLGPRKGELLGLKKVDVDLGRGLLKIRRSHGRDSTKTGKERLVPIPASIAADLERAVAISRCDYVFPGERGDRMRSDTKLTRQLRTALVLAGIVTGYHHTCRRPTCRYQVDSADGVVRPCPKCGMAFWVTPIPKMVRFQDLRHTAATLHREAGCDPFVVKTVLGHASVDVTDDVYTHCSLDFQRAELSKLRI